MFSGYTMSPDSKETRYGTRSQKTSSSVDENTGVVLVPYWWKCDPTAISNGMDIFKVPECYFLGQIFFIEGHKICFAFF